MRGSGRNSGRGRRSTTRRTKKLTSRQKQEIISTFYGINPRTLQVDSVSVTREGRLSRRGIGVTFHTHLIHQGETPRSEIGIVYELDHLIEIPTLLCNDDSSKRRLDELRARAAAMRSEREAEKIERDN